MSGTMLRATIAGETRDVEVEQHGIAALMMSVRPVGLFQRRPGTRAWPERLSFWRQPDGSYRLAQATTILNRPGYRLVGWSDDARATANLSQHNSSFRGAVRP